MSTIIIIWRLTLPLVTKVINTDFKVTYRKNYMLFLYFSFRFLLTVIQGKSNIKILKL